MPLKDESASKETVEDIKVLLKAFDKDGSGRLEESELAELKQQYAQRFNRQQLGQQLQQSDDKKDEDDAAVERALAIIQKRYDADGDGELSTKEIELLTHDVHTTDTALRYLGFTGVLARNARYFRVLAKGIVNAKLIQGSFGLAFAYIFGDVAFEAYHATKKNATNAELAHLTAKRLTFQLTASIVLPTLTLKTVSNSSSRALQRYYYTEQTMRAVRIQRVGPALCALATVPVLPFIWDPPCTFVFDALFDMVKPVGNLLSAADEKKAIAKAKERREHQK